MSGFLREWLNAMVNPMPKGGLTTMARFLPTAVSFIPPALAAVVCASVPLPWWAFVLVLLVIWWASLTAGMAWERAQCPTVEISPMQLDLGMKIFYVFVTNGAVPAKVRLRIVNVIDSFGTTHIEHPWEGHWRGHPPAGFDGDLSGYDEAQYGLLGVNVMSGSGNPTLFIFSKEPASATSPPDYSRIPISKDVPLEEQGTTTIVVTVSATAENAPRMKPRKLTFSVAPDPGSQVGYKIVTEEKRGSRENPIKTRLQRYAYLAYARLVLGRRRKHKRVFIDKTRTDSIL